MNLLAFVLFVIMLLTMMKLNRHKLHVLLCGFAALSIWFVVQNYGFAYGDEYLTEHHRFHLLFNLALLIPGFTCVAYAFERSGVAHGIVTRVTSVLLVLWIVFWLSMVLDNIAAAMIGGALLHYSFTVLFATRVV
jgi:hypothetical protein